MCAYPYNRPGGFASERDFHAPGAYPWKREFVRAERGRGHPSMYGGRGRGHPFNGPLGFVNPRASHPSADGDVGNPAQKFSNGHQSEFHRSIEILRQCLMADVTEDPVAAVQSSLQNVPDLQLECDCDFLCTMGGHAIYSGVIKLNNNFLVRGLGASKDSSKIDTYTKARELLLHTSADELSQQTDIGESECCKEVFHMFSQTPNAFYEMVELANRDAQDFPESSGFWGAPPKTSPPKQPIGGAPPPTPAGPMPLMHPSMHHAGPRSPTGPMFHPGPKPPVGLMEGQSWKDPNTLVSPNKLNVVMKPTDSLVEKLIKLKQLLKEEGITKLHIVPKIDHYAQRCAINIVNLILFVENPTGFGKPYFSVEIYFDNIRLAFGRPEPESSNAILSAYQSLANIMASLQDAKGLVYNGRRLKQHTSMDPDLCDVIVKRPGQDNGSLLTTNLANMTQMMGAGPDLTVTLDRLVLTEHDVDKDEHCFKMLELSCTRNNVLLEVEITRMFEDNFMCSMSANGRFITQCTRKGKSAAKKKCSEIIMQGLLMKNDHVFVTKAYTGPVIDKNQLVEKAKRMIQLGLTPANYHIPEHSLNMIAEVDNKKKSYQKDLNLSEVIEATAENVSLRPLIPYMAAAMYQILDDYYQKVTLEDIIINTANMAKSQYEMVNHCASQMGFRVITRIKHPAGPNCSLLRRTVTAQEMAWVCQLHGGTSGRFTLKKSAHPKSASELARLKAAHHAHHAELVRARDVEKPANPDNPHIKPLMSLGGETDGWAQSRQRPNEYQSHQSAYPGEQQAAWSQQQWERPGNTWGW